MDNIYSHVVNMVHSCEGQHIMIEIRVNELLGGHGKSFYWLAKETGISHTTLWRLKKGKALGINFDTLEKLCDALNCQTGEVLALANDKKANKSPTNQKEEKMIGTAEKPFTIRFVGHESDVHLELTNATDHALKGVEVLTVFLKDEETPGGGPSQAHIKFEALTQVRPKENVVLSHKTWINGKIVARRSRSVATA